jgi:hypothetical protein
MSELCQYCEQSIGKRNKQLIALCEAKDIQVCSIECLNDLEAEALILDDLLQINEDDER